MDNNVNVKIHGATTSHSDISLLRGQSRVPIFKIINALNCSKLKMDETHAVMRSSIQGAHWHVLTCTGVNLPVRYKACDAISSINCSTKTREGQPWLISRL